MLSLKNKGTQTMVALSYIRDGALVLTQRRTLGLDLPMLGGTSFVFSTLLDLVTPEDVNGLYSMTDSVLGADISPASADYVKRFAARFGMKADPFGSCYYDAAMMLADIMRHVGTDRVKIREAFAAMHDYHGVTRSFTTDSRNDMAHTVSLVKFLPGTKTTELVGIYPPTTP